MKMNPKQVLRLLGIGTCSFWMLGCEVEAEEGANDKKAAADSNAVPAQVQAGPAAATNTAGNATALAQAPAGGTNAPAATNNVTNQQTVIVQKIPPTTPPGLKLSKGVEEIIKLAQSGVSETVVLLYIEKFEHPFDLDAAEILYLNDIGISSTIIAAMLSHDGASTDLQEVLSKTNKAEVAAAPPSTPPQQSTAVVTQPAPAQVEVSSNYVATAPPAGTQQPVQQQPVVVEQPPVVVQQPVIVTQPAVTYSYFYSSLAPYGSWVYVTDYGWCWQPTIALVHRGWRPYVHGGGWLYTDYGWYWKSDYTWGWAPFHYGRWHCSPGYGWLWVPDYTWGPSWVTWRRAGSYCGWAPLPPRAYVRPGIGFSYWDRDVGFSFSFGLTHEHFAFVPASRFCDRRIIDHVVPTEKTVNIYKDSTVVNNYIVGNNNTIVNRGIAPDFVARHSRSEIRPIAVREAPAGPGKTIEPDRIVKQGNELVVYRPSQPAAPSVSAASVDGRRENGARAPESPTTRRVDDQPPVSRGVVESRTRPSEPAAAPRLEGSGLSAASRDFPIVAKPEPLRPEPRVESLPMRSTRAGSEIRARGPERFGSGLVATSSSGRPEPLSPAIGAGTRTVSPRFAPSAGAVNRPADSEARTDTVRPITRPSIPGAGFGTPSRAESIRREASFQPAAGANVNRLEATRPSAAPRLTEQSIPGAPARIESRVVQPGFSRPAQVPQASLPPGTISRGTYAAPSINRGTPITPSAPAPASRVVTVTPRAAEPGGLSPVAPSAVTRPPVTTRPEGFGQSRSIAPAAPAPSAPTLQPRVIMPAAPSSAPSRMEAPVNRGMSVPSRNEGAGVTISPSRIQGGNFSPAPPAAAPRPSVSQPSQPQASGRGRIEIGR